jgi:hypothetical protein
MTLCAVAGLVSFWRVSCWVQPQKDIVLQQLGYRAGLTCVCQLLQLPAAICMLLVSLEWLGPATAVIQAPLNFDETCAPPAGSSPYWVTSWTAPTQACAVQQQTC